MLTGRVNSIRIYENMIDLNNTGEVTNVFEVSFFRRSGDQRVSHA
jgi:hypothetical protein